MATCLRYVLLVLARSFLGFLKAHAGVIETRHGHLLIWTIGAYKVVRTTLEKMNLDHLMFHRVIPTSVLGVVALGFLQSIWLILYKPWSAT